MIQQLISAGHSLSEIAGYSLAQVELFGSEAAAVERRRLKAFAIAGRAAAADKKGFAQFLKELT